MEVLEGKPNYASWRVCIKNYLMAQGLWDVVEDTSGPPKEDEDDMDDWRRKDLIALHAIQTSCAPSMLSYIPNHITAKDAWNTLAEICHPQAPSLTQQVDWEVNRSDALAFLKIIQRSDRKEISRQLSRVDPHSMNVKIRRITERTMLHLAVMERKLDVVEVLLWYLSEEDVTMRDKFGQTALHFAAMCPGNTKIAESLITKCRELLTIQTNDGIIPLVCACIVGRKDMAHYLYEMTTPAYLLNEENRNHAVSVLCCCVRGKMFDIAWDLLSRRPDLAVARCPKLKVVDEWEIDNTDAVLSLSRQPSAFLSCSELSFWQRCIYSCLKVKQPEALSRDQNEAKNLMMQVERKPHGLWSNLLKFFGIGQIYDLKLTHVYAHELLLLMSKAIAALDEEYVKGSSNLKEAIITATKRGIKEFIVEVIKTNPDLLRDTGDKDFRNIFMIAVAHRQEKIFSLIYPHEAIKYEFPAFSDKYHNNMFHWAGRLEAVSQFKLEQISGSALQLQRELQWFKEVERIVPPGHKEAKNDEGKTPYEVFDESHAELMKKGEQWMKDIAQSSTIVGALIITMMFAALFTVPGGNNQDTGIPLLLNKKLFKVFLISDAISLFASSTSVLVFVGILTSRYSKDDFLTSLPKRLIIGLLALFISIATMMVAFCSTVIIMVKGQLEIVLPIVVLAAIPVCVFAWLQFPLLVRITISTYGPGIFDKKMNKWL